MLGKHHSILPHPPLHTESIPKMCAEAFAFLRSLGFKKNHPSLLKGLEMEGMWM